MSTLDVPAARTTDDPRTDRVVLADGAVARRRRLGPDDAAAVASLYAALPPDDRWLRFLSASAPAPDRSAHNVLDPPAFAVGVLERDELVGAGHVIPDPGGGTGELALVVAHGAHHRGVGTLLVEALIELAVEQGLRTLTAEVAGVNAPMLEVLTDLGRPVRRTSDGTTTAVEIPVGDVAGLSGAGWGRARRAAAAGMRPVLAPGSVAVVGVSRRGGSVGRAVWDRLRASGYTGDLTAVNPHGPPDADAQWVRSVSALERPVDLAVLCVPAEQVADVAAECGRAGVRALLVVSSMSGSDGRQQLADTVRHHGMRLVGPNCLGVANTDPAVGLEAMFAEPGAAGRVGVAADSGGVAIALAAELSRLGLGVSSLVSTGDGLDVAADDLLAWWAADERTEAGVLYLETTRRPHTFSGLARDLTSRMPLVAIRSGRSEAGRRAAASHTAATATPRAVRDALMHQAGIVAVDDVGQAAATVALLAWQPLPAGRRIGIVSNAGGLGVLAADAVVAAGLAVAAPGPGSRERLAALLPRTAALGGPVDTTATVAPGTFADVVSVLADDPGVDAVLALGAPTDLGDPLAQLGRVAVRTTPLLAVRAGQAATVEPVHGDGRPVPCFADGTTAVTALAGALARRARLGRDSGTTVPDGVDRVRAREVIGDATPDDDGWLSPTVAYDLLDAAGIPAVAGSVVTDADGAVRCWRSVGGPVVLKADAAGVVHKARAGGVLTGLDSESGVRDGFRTLRERFGPRLRGVLVQPRLPVEHEMLVGVTGDAVFGPMLTVGPGGTGTDLAGDRGHLLVPAAVADVDDVLESLRCAPVVFAGGGRGHVRDVLLRLGWLATVLPEITAAEINPLLVGAGGVRAVDVRVRIHPRESAGRGSAR